MQIAVVCPACATRVEVAPERIGEVLRDHNVSRHGGEAVAHVAPEHLGRLDAAE